MGFYEATNITGPSLPVDEEFMCWICIDSLASYLDIGFVWICIDE